MTDLRPVIIDNGTLVELREGLARVHSTIGLGEGHGSVAATVVCIVSAIGDLKDECELLREARSDYEKEIRAVLREKEQQTAELRARLEAAEKLIEALNNEVWHRQNSLPNIQAAACVDSMKAQAAYQALKANGEDK